MGLGTLSIAGDTTAAKAPAEYDGSYLVERWIYKNADSNRTNDIITCRRINRIAFVRGANQDNYGSSDPFTINNTAQPPTVTVFGVVATEGGQIDIYGY